MSGDTDDQLLILAGSPNPPPHTHTAPQSTTTVQYHTTTVQYSAAQYSTYSNTTNKFHQNILLLQQYYYYNNSNTTTNIVNRSKHNINMYVCNYYSHPPATPLARIHPGHNPESSSSTSQIQTSQKQQQQQNQHYNIVQCRIIPCHCRS